MRYVLERGVLGPSLRIEVHEVVDTQAHPRRAIVRGLDFKFGTKLAALLNAALDPKEPEGLTDAERERYDALVALVRDLVDFAEPHTIAQERAVDRAEAFLADEVAS